MVNESDADTSSHTNAQNSPHSRRKRRISMSSAFEKRGIGRDRPEGALRSRHPNFVNDCF
jgi:hypothetical protein